MTFSSQPKPFILGQSAHVYYGHIDSRDLVMTSWPPFKLQSLEVRMVALKTEGNYHA